MKQLHDKYGDVVQISPNEVSFTSNTAWQDIYGFRTGKHKGHLNMQKDPVWYTRSPTGQSIITADDADHSRFRKVLAHAFSAQALAKQEDILHRYVDLLVNRLKETLSTDERPQDMTEWYNWTTFDVIADLMFGEPFGCLQNRETHKYITLIFLSIRALRMGYIMSYYPWVKWFGNWIVDKKSLAGRKEYYNWVVSRTQTRMDRETQRPDFMTEVLKNNGKKDAELTTTEIYSNFGVLLTAGSETSATLLSGLTYLLGKNPEVHQKLKDEVRGRFKNFGDINCKEVNDLPYLLAVLQEALRYFPPVPTGFERRVGPGGEFVSGCFIPANTAVCVSAYPAGHSERNFKDSSLFVPERWLNDPRYAGDKKDSIQPFSIGPRNCLGKVSTHKETCFDVGERSADRHPCRTSHTLRCD